MNNFFKTTFRNLWKNKGYSFLNIFGLAIGIACAGLIFLWVEDEMYYDHYHNKRNDLYQLMENQAYEGKIYTFGATPGLLAQGIKSEFPGVINSCRTTWQQTQLFSLGDKAIYENGLYGDSSIFSMFTLPFVQGSPDKCFEQIHSLVISEKMAKKFFGDEKNIVGKSLKVDNKNNYIITGVIKDLPENSTLQFEWVAPFKIYADDNTWLQYWGNNGIQTFVELNGSTNADGLDKKLYNYIQSKDTGAVAKLFLFSMNDWRLRGNFQDGKQTGGRIEYVRMFSVIAWIILLIACINFMNLATARCEKRAKEVGVKKVLGAVKSRLISQFIGEAIMMSFIAVMLALCVTALALPAFNTLVEKHLDMGLADPLHITALLVIGLICGVVAGSYPSFYLSSFNPVSVLKGLKLKNSGAAYIRKGLVILQFTISIVLIISTIIIYQQIQHVKERDLGYNKDNLIETSLQGELKDHFSVVKQDLLATGYVENTAMAALNLLYMGSSTADFSWAGKDPGKKVLITQDWVSPEYINTTGTHIKQGRDFYPDAKQDSLSVIVNETLAAMIDKENAVGKILNRDSIKYTIVGVTKDFVYGDMYGKSDPLVFFCYPGNYYNMYIRVKPRSNTENALAKIEAVVKKDNPGYPFDYRFVDDSFNQLFMSEMLIGKLSRIFALLAMVISCLGLFGLAAYTAERRTKEIGVRKVLGASVSSVTALLSKDFLQLVTISAVIAFPLAWWLMHNWLQDYQYRIDISIWVFAVAGFAALFISLLTVSFQAIKAAIANPVKSLRTE